MDKELFQPAAGHLVAMTMCTESHLQCQVHHTRRQLLLTPSNWLQHIEVVLQELAADVGLQTNQQHMSAKTGQQRKNRQLAKQSCAVCLLL